MKQQDETILDQKDVKQFTYKNIMQEKRPDATLFRHDDNSINKVFVYRIGGYVALSVIPHNPIKPAGADRRLMLQNRKQQVVPTQQWAQKHQPKDAGWKFHLSIAQNPTNLEKAWEILVPILLKYKIGETKIVHEKNEQEASKVITVYTFSGGPQLDQWRPFLKDVELAFRQKGIEAGEKIFEYQIKGSNYFYYRNDADHKGEYVSDEHKFLYRVVDKLPVSNEQELEMERELKEGQHNIGCIVKLKGAETCCLYVKDGNGWDRQEFNINLLKNLENPDQNHQIIIAPIINRPAYLDLVVPRLDQSIPSTNNVTKEPLPFQNIDLDKELAHDVTPIIGQLSKSFH